MLPDPVSGSDARAAARRELATSIYHRDDPSPLRQAYDWVLHRFGDLFDRVADVVSSGLLGVLIVGGVIIGVIALILWLVGPPRVRDLLADRGPGERLRTAADERAEARRLADEGRYDDALRCTTRALVRELEARGVLEPRPGRTPRGIASEAGAATPSAASDVRTVTDAFELVWFGRHTPTAELWASARDAELRVRDRRLVVSA